MQTKTRSTVTVDRELSVMVANTPGQLARATSALGLAGVNLFGVMTVNVGAKACLRFIPGAAVEARARLEDAGFRVSERPVFRFPLPKGGTALDELATALGERGINILSCYGHEEAGALQLVLAVDRPDEAAPLIETLG